MTRLMKHYRILYVIAWLFLLTLCGPISDAADARSLNALQPSLADSALRWDETNPDHNVNNEVPITPYLPATAVIIDVGHGGVDGGASHGSLYEKDINLEVGKRLYALLQSRGIPAIMNRSHDYALSDDNRWHRTSSRHLRDLSQRMGLTREIKHVIFVSLHVNSGTPRAHGPLVLHQKSGESYLLASSIQSEMNNLYNTAKRPIAVKTFYVLKHVKSPAVLIELGFISNSEDRARLTSPPEQTNIARSIADGISQYFWIN